MTVTFNRISNDPQEGIVATLTLDNPSDELFESTRATWVADTLMGQYYEILTVTPDTVVTHTSSDLDALSVEDDGIEVLSQVDTGRSISHTTTDYNA